MTRYAVLVAMLMSCARPVQSPASQPSQPPQRPAAQAAAVPAPAAPEAVAATTAAAPPAATPTPAGALRTDPFGGERWGFVEASSVNGRLVFIRIFPTKPTSFGHHGEPDVLPELFVFDRVSDDMRAVDELIDIDATRRWMLVIDDDSLWLADSASGVWETVDDVDMEPDGNACLAPRQGNFSIQGRRVGWVRANASALMVRDLASGEQWAVAAQGRLWRGWPDDDGRGAVLIEVAAAQGWPVQKTSCACRWCNRFAMSYGVYGWAGPGFQFAHVAEDGTRKPSQPPESKAVIHGPTENGCELKPARTDSEMDQGPWRWVCSEQP